MLQDAGFSRVDYLNLSDGIVALHKGISYEEGRCPDSTVYLGSE